jgi:radial spoke head protein 1
MNYATTQRLDFQDGRVYNGQVTLSFTGLIVAHGYGTLQRRNGETYMGMFDRGKKHGQGTHYDPTIGRTYEGWYVNDEEEGSATVTRPGALGGRRNFVGYMYRGMRHGWGRQTETMPDGETVIWEGQWSMDVLDGMGSVTLSGYYNARVTYEGRYVMGRLDGPGWATDYATNMRWQVYFQGGNVVQ